MFRTALRALRLLGAEAFDALFVAMSSLVSDKTLGDFRGVQPEDAWRDEVAEHLGAIRALMEDARNVLQHETDALIASLFDHK